MENPLGRDVSHIKTTAVLAVSILVGVFLWQATQSLNGKPASSSNEALVAADQNTNGAQNTTVPTITTSSATNTDPITAVSDEAVGELVGAYAGLQQQGSYSSTTGAAIASSIGMGLQVPTTYSPISATAIKTSSDTSYQAMMQYRSNLQTTLKPLLKNTTPEYVLFGMYVQTKQQKYLDQLLAAAGNYAAAASSTLTLTVPADAVQVQLGLVNSMNEFATTLNNMTAHASDPIASSVLLENYNNAENDVLGAFQALVTYEQSKTK
ncbi:MAG: hypothetical protein P4L81_00750 [Candidatus Pacebacteria bacterium]|nr:hypothetical protein [Candidatus Paceibacterota bacterium]